MAGCLALILQQTNQIIAIGHSYTFILSTPAMLKATKVVDKNIFLIFIFCTKALLKAAVLTNTHSMASPPAFWACQTRTHCKSASSLELASSVERHCHKQQH